MFAHFEALEADFQREYGLDLASCLYSPDPAKRVGPRKLRSFINGLSPRSQFIRTAVANGQDWGSAEELLASLIEQVDLGNRLFFMANAKKGTTPWKALHIPRPTVAKRKPSSKTELMRFFGASGGRVRVT